MQDLVPAQTCCELMLRRLCLGLEGLGFRGQVRVQQLYCDTVSSLPIVHGRCNR